MEPFVHLHVHTEYSLLDGANRIQDLVQATVEDGHSAIAITDHGNLFGAVEFYKACRAAGVKPILGCEVYVAQVSHKQRHHRRDNPYTHLTLLARNAEGWRNLMDLSSLAHLEGHHFRPRIDLEVLQGRGTGITCLSGCMSGPVNRELRKGDEEQALHVAGRLQDIFGKDFFYLEVMRNGIEEQDRLTEGMVRLQQRLGAPLIATNDIHYLRHEDCQVQDTLLCIHTGARREDPDRWRMDTDTLYFRTREEMNRIFADLPEALRNTLEVAEQVDLSLELGKYRLPRFEPEDGSSPEEMFRRLCEEGFARLYPGNPPEARQRLEYEMKVIREMGFVSYFLIVWDLIHYARKSGIPVGPGRGSAAGSLVAYCLGITRIDPLKYDLLFERFLNPSRISMPDIDIDFCKDRREEMIQYTRRKYGDDHVAQIITFGKMKAKAALRDVARTLDIPLPEVDKVAKKVPADPKATLAGLLKTDKEFADLARSSEIYQQWIQLAMKIEGLSRHSSVHAAGVVIADRPLREVVPLSRQDEVITTQWDMKVCEEVGLLKMDFLGLRTLTILEDALRLVRERRGEVPELGTLPLDDPRVYELLQAADTEGVFQLESDGMRRLLADLRPSSYEDLIAVLALFRPGPLRSGLHETFARRKHGQERVTYDHPLLEPILRNTYGVLIYQEQIMRVAQRLGGFSLAEADSLRKAMGKKDARLMAGFESKFLDGCQASGVPDGTARQIWNMMVQFAEYGFNKSHSAAYAMVTYQAAWMKAHYPEEFYAATFTHEAHDTDKLRILIEDARRHDIEVLPPCVQESGPAFQVPRDGCVRYGLAAVKGVGQGAAEALVQRRSALEGGRFAGYDEFLAECVAAGLNKSTLECLLKAGALDALGGSRLALLADLEEGLRIAQRTAADRERGQGSLFDLGGPAPGLPAGSAAPAGNEPPDEEDARILLEMEKEALGLYLTRHPLDPYRHILEGIAARDSRTLREAGDGSGVALAGLVTLLQIRPTRRDPNRKYARMRIEDLYGSVPAVVWPDTLESVRDHLQEDLVGVFEGTLEISDEEVTLMVQRIRPLGRPGEVRLRGDLWLDLDADSPLEELARILQAHPGNALVRFRYTDPEGRQRILRAGSEWRVSLDGALLGELNRLLGEGRAQVHRRPGQKDQVQVQERRRYPRERETSARS